MAAGHAEGPSGSGGGTWLGNVDLPQYMVELRTFITLEEYGRAVESLCADGGDHTLAFRPCTGLVRVTGAQQLCVFKSALADAVVRFLPADGLVLADVVAGRLGDADAAAFSADVSAFADRLQAGFRAAPLRKHERIVSLPRVSTVPQIHVGSMRELRVHAFDAVLFDRASAYQSVRVLRHPEFGNTLVLDDEINLSEADTVYTESLMRKADIDYAGADVLILGGGDGALLRQILPLRPKFVTMLELDEVVLEAARLHLRSVCGDSLDTMIGDRHEIIVGDCFPTLDAYAAAGRNFDVIICDLTDVPVAAGGDIVARPSGGVELSADFWSDSMHERTVAAALRLLRPHNGRLLTHVGGAGNRKLIGSYEALLCSLLRGTCIHFDKIVAMVPGFLETWAFYQIREDNERR